MKKLMLLLLICIAGILTAEQVTVQVLDSELDMELEGVRVVADCDGVLIKGETDSTGIALLDITTNAEGVIVTAQYPGYADSTVTLTNGQTSVNIKLSIGGVIEGEEIVVQRSVDKRKEAEVGISKVIEKDEINITAQMGIVEDVMSTVKTLPGVGYTAAFSGERPSIRGGHPDEMVTAMDGVYLIHPWHWGGAYSVFNPLMTDSAKMSHGIYSARYGKALSGLLEVSTLDPNPDKVAVDFGLSTTSADLFAQVPLGKHNAVLFGGKLTFLEGIVGLYDLIGATDEPLGDTLPTPPYIRDFYAKWKCTPSDRFNISLNLFFGSDGTGAAQNIAKEDASEDTDNQWGVADFDYTGYLGYAALNMNIIPTEKSRIRVLGAYNFQYDDVYMYSGIQGEYAYSDDFIAAFDVSDLTGDTTADGKINGVTKYTLPLMESEYEEKITVHEMQAKVETDFELSKNNVLTFGAEEVLRFSNSREFGSMWMESKASGTPVFYPVELEINADGNKVFQSAAFALWEFGSDATLLKGEAGLRLDHVYISGDGVSINVMPTLNPRLSVQYTPLRNKGVLDALTISAGTGLFSQINKLSLFIDKKMNIDESDMGSDRMLMCVLGANAKLVNGWNFSLEGYYKQYLSRLFVPIDDTDMDNILYYPHMDGQGHVAGFEAMLQKKGKGKFSGYVSYSFVYAQFKNPYDPLYEGQVTQNGEQLDTWFYPSYHRFHTINLVANWNIAPRFSLALMGTIATGKPLEDNGNVTSYPVKMPDGTIIQRYTRSTFYSDTLRSDISCPVDVKFTFKSKESDSKVKWEAYVALEDIFVNLYSAKAGTSINEYTGAEVENEADFSIGLPIPSIGFKMKY